MPPWILKAALQGVIAQLPASRRLNELLQRYVTHSLTLGDEVFEDKWRQCVRHFAHYREVTRRSPVGKVVLELGTGWHPVVPVGLVLLGAGHVFTVDTENLLSRARFLEVARRFLPLADAGKIELPDSDGLARVRTVLEGSEHMPLSRMLESVRITSVVGDARDLPVARDSVDLFVSNNTFEHISPEPLADILREFRRVGSPGAVGSHYIDMSDHYSNFDESINAYNYLKFSHRVWRLFDSELQHQNRLRLPDYRRLCDQSGWSIVSEEHKLGSLEELRRVRISRDFARYSEQDIRIYAAWVLARASRRR